MTKIIVGGAFAAMIVLRLCGLLDWSWLKIAAPLWFGPAIAIGVALVLFVLLTLLRIVIKAWL